MTDDLRLSPDALAAISVPEGVTATKITSREAWLSERKRDITASVSAALFGEHPYMTPYRLWAIHSGLESADAADNKLFKRGRLLEPVILELLREEFPTWTIDPCRTYYREPTSRLGATPDFIATRPDRSGFGVIEGKSVGKFAFKKGWRDLDGDMSIPLWVGVQVSQTAMLSGASWSMIAPMEIGDGALDLHTEEVDAIPALMAKMGKLAADFWRRVEGNDPYQPNYGRDAATIAQIYGDDDGSEIDLDPAITQIVLTRDELKEIERAGDAAAKQRKLIDAEIIHTLGNASRGRLSDGRLIEAKTVRRRGYEVQPSQYRTVKIKAATRNLIPYAGAEA